ncbi:MULTISPECIES: adenylate/guanylate cyclase domain-containing protein [Microbacterium]|uniref:adenylate/guanylate cyclase domain-containing protein n=1 Tax=Microbacterium TaxID=33882 RepID=UPI00146D63E0|nr:MULTISPECIES: adenylate/guanylate cyclase domain-containing protein [Microbacterium]
MTLRDDLHAYVKKTHADQWQERKGQKVPELGDLKFSTDAVNLDATVLYADLADSTNLVANNPNWLAAEVYKNYLYCAAKIIRSNGGSITAYDGDRVMAVFIGTDKNTKAVDTALKIQWSVGNILQPAFDKKYSGRYDYKYKQKVGVDTSELFVAKTGFRGSDELVWVGNAANYAAKLAALNRGRYTYISKRVYDVMHKSAKFGGTPEKNMWEDMGTSDFGFRVYGSTWRRPF